MNLLHKLWTWYGKRTGMLTVPEHSVIYGQPDHYPDLVYRGVMDGDTTLLFRAWPLRVLVFNRALNEAEIAQVRGSELCYDGTAGALCPAPGAMGKQDSSMIAEVKPKQKHT